MAARDSDCDVEIIKEVIAPKIDVDSSPTETDMDCDVEIVKEIPAPAKVVDFKLIRPPAPLSSCSLQIGSDEMRVYQRVPRAWDNVLGSHSSPPQECLSNLNCSSSLYIPNPHPNNSEFCVTIDEVDIPRVVTVMKGLHLDPAKYLGPFGRFRLAECKKEEGNALYKQERYLEALQRYSDAIGLCPECTSFYSNRAACHMMVQDYHAALEDIQMSLKIDENFVKGHLRAAKCYISLGDLSGARRHLQRMQEIDPKTPGLASELSSLSSLESHFQRFEACYGKCEYRQALFHVERLLEASKACKRFRLFRSECLAALTRYQEAQEIANDILKDDPLNADAHYIRGLCLYYQDNLDKAFSHFQRVLQLAPDHSKAKDIYKKAKTLKSQKEAGNTAFKNGQLEEAYNVYTSALNIDPSNIFTNAKIYFNRATVCSKIKKLNQAIEDCTNAIKLDGNYLKAYLRRAKCYLDSEMYDDAVRDYETIYSKEKSKENKRLLDHAKLELKKSKRKDYYKILGITKTATDDEIKKAYKKQALVHHPDRHSNETDEKKLEQEKKFKELGEAYAILSDTKKRHRYDNGMDLEDEAAEFDPTMFQSFFAGPGGFFGGSNSSYNRTFSSGFPGGYGNSFSFHFA